MGMNMADVLLSPSHIGSSIYSKRGKSSSASSSSPAIDPDTDTDIDDGVYDVTIEDVSGIMDDVTKEINTTEATSVGDMTINSKSTRLKQDRPKSSFLDSSPDKDLSDFLASPSVKSTRASASASGSAFASAATATASKSVSVSAVGSPSPRRKPFRNLSNLMNTFKKGLTRHTTVGTMRDELVEVELDDADEEDGDEDEDEVEENHFEHSSPSQFHHPSLMSSPPNSPTRSKKLPTRTQKPGTIRRIHSMYHTEKEKAPISMETNSILAKSTLKHFKVANDLLPRITEDDMHNILMGVHSKEFDEFIIIDSRFQYEYLGGHIKGAISISSQQDLEDKLINNCNHNGSSSSPRKLVIFHCEFSIFRGPTMASHLRKCDRIANAANYPRLTYPDIVVLEGGYKRFYDKYRKQHCEPQSYVEMKDINHQKTCEIEMHKVRQASKLTRAKSYQFGQQKLKQQPLNSLLQQPQNPFRPSVTSGPVATTSNISTTTTRPKSFQHMRSSSYTTVTSHSESLKILKRQKSISKMKSFTDVSANSPSSGLGISTPPPPIGDEDVTRSHRSSTISYSQSIFNSTSSPASSPTMLNYGHFDDDSCISPAFQPPPAFRSLNSLNKRSLNGVISTNYSSSSSINSYMSTSDQGLAFSSTDSLSDSYSSPMMEYNDFFTDKSSSYLATLSSLKHSNSNSYLNNSNNSTTTTTTNNNNHNNNNNNITMNNCSHTLSNSTSNFNSVLNPLAKKPTSALPQLPRNSIQPQLQFKFPIQGFGVKAKSSRNRLNTSTPTIQTSTTLPLVTSSPVISSPLSTITPASDSAKISNISSIIDPINDTPVDFSVPSSQKQHFNKHSRRRSGLMLSSGCFNYITLDIDEIDEEDDNDGDGTLTEIKFTKSPFNI